MRGRQIKHKLLIVLDALRPAVVFQRVSAVGKPIKGTWTTEKLHGPNVRRTGEPRGQEQG